MPVLFSRRLKGWRFVLFNVVLGAAHAIVLFGAGAYIALLPHVTGDLGGLLPSFGTWAQTDFMIALALAFPVARWLGGRVGEYRLFIVAFVAYAAASYFCAISPSLDAFLPARLLLGFAGGLTLPLGQALLLKEYPDRRKSVGLAVWGVFTLLPFTVGLPLGGWLADELGWRALFHVNVPISLAIAGTTGALLYGRGFERTDRSFDFIGFVLLAVILGGIQTILNQGNDFDWMDSSLLRTLLIVVVVAVPCFIIWELGEEHPAVDVTLFRHRNFVIGLVGLAAGFFSLQGLLSLFIVQLQLLMGYSSTLAGLVFLPMILLGAPVICAMHELSKRVDARLLASLNFLGFAITFYWIGLFDDPSSYDQIFWPMLLEGVFLGAFFTPLTILTVHGLTGDQMLRAAAGALGITSQGIILFRRLPFHQLQLADHFGGRVSVSFDALQGFMTRLERMGVDAGMMKAKLATLIKQQAGILALNDAFLVASYLCVGLAILVWFAHSTRFPVSRPETETLQEWRASWSNHDQTDLSDLSWCESRARQRAPLCALDGSGVRLDSKRRSTRRIHRAAGIEGDVGRSHEPATVTKIHVSEQGNSVWTSLAKPDTAEYQTDVYGDELTSAESLAQGVMEGNLVLKGVNANGGKPVDQAPNQEKGRKAGEEYDKKREHT